MLKKHPYILNFIKCFMITWALMKAFSLNTGNILTGILFIFAFMLVKKVSNIVIEKRTKIIASVAGVIFTILYLLNSYELILGDLSNPLFILIVLTTVAIGLLVLFYNILVLICDLALSENVCRYILLSEDKPVNSKYSVFIYNHIFIITFILCILGYIPYFLYQYPGIMTPDSINQYEQALHMIPYSNHHPWLHTLIIELCVNIAGLFTNSMNAKAAFYTIVQMLFMAISGAYTVNTLKKLNVKPALLYIAIAFYAFVPYNAVYAITVWKDVPFAGLTSLFTCALIRIDLKLKSDDINIKLMLPELIIILLTGVGMSLFRSNGFYGFIVFIPAGVLYFKNRIYGKRVIACFLIALVIVLIFKIPVMKSFDVKKPDMIENIAIPLQQVSAVLVNDRYIEPGDMEEIKKIVDLTYIKDLYVPTYGDNIKELFRAGNPEYLAANKMTFAKIYIKLGFNYPLDYLKAYGKQTYGFYYPDRDYGVADTEGIIASDIDLHTEPIIAGRVIVKLKEIVIKLADMIPVYGLIWSAGTIFWFLLLAMTTGILMKDYKKIVFLLPTFLITMTLFIATPIANEIRYAYFLMYQWPLIISLIFVKKSFD